jgi:hypothetical protein
MNQPWPVPPVSEEDLARVWTLINETSVSGSKGSGAVGFDRSLVASQCISGTDANVLAVFVRACILKEIAAQGLLANWINENQPRGVVFRQFAAHPLTSGTDAFDPREFLITLSVNAEDGK